MRAAGGARDLPAPLFSGTGTTVLCAVPAGWTPCAFASWIPGEVRQAALPVAAAHFNHRLGDGGRPGPGLCGKLVRGLGDPAVFRQRGCGGP